MAIEQDGEEKNVLSVPNLSREQQSVVLRLIHEPALMSRVSEAIKESGNPGEFHLQNISHDQLKTLVDMGVIAPAANSWRLVTPPSKKE